MENDIIEQINKYYAGLKEKDRAKKISRLPKEQVDTLDECSKDEIDEIRKHMTYARLGEYLMTTNQKKASRCREKIYYGMIGQMRDKGVD